MCREVRISTDFTFSNLKHMLIEGLANLKDERAQTMSLDWAARWTRSNFLGYKDSFVMYEKVSQFFLATRLDSTDICRPIIISIIQ